MIAKKDTVITKKKENKLYGMKKKPKYTENLVILKRHYRADVEPLMKVSHQPKYNFLKYWRIVRKWAYVKYDLSIADLELLLFLYDEGLWKLQDFVDATEIYSWDTKRLHKFLDKGLTRVWRERKGYESRAKLYELTPKAKRICKSVYRL